MRIIEPIRPNPQHRLRNNNNPRRNTSRVCSSFTFWSAWQLVLVLCIINVWQSMHTSFLQQQGIDLCANQYQQHEGDEGITSNQNPTVAPFYYYYIPPPAPSLPPPSLESLNTSKKAGNNNNNNNNKETINRVGGQRRRAFFPSTTTQCNRTYGAILDFVVEYPTTDSCPDLPHQALRLGHHHVVGGGDDPSINNATNKHPTEVGVGHSSYFKVQNCQFKWFYPNEACDLIGSVGILYFDGDSLIRQLLVGLGAVLDGNFRSGGLAKQQLPSDYLQACQCEKQWQCWKPPSTHRFDHSGNNDNEEEEPQFTMCPKWTRNHIKVGNLQDVRNQTAGPITIVANGKPLHRNLYMPDIRNDLEGYKNFSQATGGTFIPMTVHYPGPNKPLPYKYAQGEFAVERYNNELWKWALSSSSSSSNHHHDDETKNNSSTNSSSVWPLDTYNFTKGMWSRDGVHYDDDNIVIVQFLLNQLWYLQQSGHLAILPEANEEDPSNFLIGDPQDVNVTTYIGSVPRPY